MNLLRPIALLSLLLVTMEARAQINIPVIDVSLDYATGNSTYNVTLNLGGTSRGVYVDPFKIATTTAITGPLATTAEIAAIKDTALWFCMDPLQTIAYGNSGGNLVYQSIKGTDFNVYTDKTVAQALDPNVKGGLNTTEIADLKKLFTANYVLASKDSLTAAALQIAIWEVVNESSTADPATKYKLVANQWSGAGQFSITGYNSQTLIDKAQGMLTALATYNAPFTGALDFLVDGTYTSSGNCVVVQDLVGWDPPPIPESSNFAIGALGLLSVGVIAKLRSRKISASKLTAA